MTNITALPATFKPMEQMLWDAACSIRGEKDAAKFKNYLLPLLFLKRLSDVFDDEIERLTGRFLGRRVYALGEVQSQSVQVRKIFRHSQRPHPCAIHISGCRTNLFFHCQGGGIRHAPGVWFDEEAVECTIYSEEYEKTLTVLLLDNTGGYDLLDEEHEMDASDMFRRWENIS